MIFSEFNRWLDNAIRISKIIVVSCILILVGYVSFIIIKK